MRLHFSRMLFTVHDQTTGQLRYEIRSRFGRIFRRYPDGSIGSIGEDDRYIIDCCQARGI